MLAEAFALLELPLWAPRYNIAPTQPVPVIRLAPPPDPPERQLAVLRWGLIPHWAKDAAIGNRMINARAETVAEKPAFRGPLRRKRCLVVADGFYEWQKVGRGKQPYFIHRQDDRPFAFAGLWDAWEGPDHSLVESCTLLTTTPNLLVTPIHDRMPLVLPAEHYAGWLDPALQEAKALLSLLAPWPSQGWEAFPVGPHVNSPSHEDAACLTRAER